MRCRREDIDEPVSQGEVHRFIADTVYKAGKEDAVLNKLIKERLPRTHKRIAIVGAGPAGLTAAFYLARLGHEVTVYEANKEAGGILRYGIPEYRLPKAVLAHEVAFVHKMGVKFVFNRQIATEDLKKLERDFDAVFLATGAYKNMSLGIPGEHLDGVISGTHYLEEGLNGRKPRAGKTVLIIGAGNVAVDAARTAFRAGANVTIVYRRDKADMPANKEEILEAEKEGIKFIFFAAPKQVLDDGNGKVRALEVVKMLPGDFDVSGRKKPISTNETYEIPCDTIMLAIGERVDSDFLKEFGIVLNQDGTVQINHFSLRTNFPRVYAGGDLVTGPSTAVEASAFGKDVARVIDGTLMADEKRFETLFRRFDYENKVPVKPSSAKKQTGKRLTVPQRKGNFKEVSMGLSRLQADLETLRCLRCDVKDTNESASVK
jgi:NADH-quinone oxidoreductase subunit F